jgi:hypothetical protein
MFVWNMRAWGGCVNPSAKRGQEKGLDVAFSASDKKFDFDISSNAVPPPLL